MHSINTDSEHDKPYQELQVGFNQDKVQRNYITRNKKTGLTEEAGTSKFLKLIKCAGAICKT